jgi:hypothetical protein
MGRFSMNHLGESFEPRRNYTLGSTRSWIRHLARRNLRYHACRHPGAGPEKIESYFCTLPKAGTLPFQWVVTDERFGQGTQLPDWIQARSK